MDRGQAGQPQAPGAAPVLNVEGLRKVYSGRPVVESVSLTVSPGEVVGLLGPNGAGKTTTLPPSVDDLRYAQQRVI